MPRPRRVADLGCCMAQGIYGYLPLEVQRVIADGLELPLAEVSGVVSFYSFFSTQRRGRHTIRACAWARRATCAGASASWSGSGSCSRSRWGIPRRTACSRWVARCIGILRAGSPAMSIDDTVYKRVNPDHLEHILAQYAPEKEGEAV